MRCVTPPPQPPIYFRIVFWVENSIAASQLQGPEFGLSSGCLISAALLVFFPVLMFGFPVGYLYFPHLPKPCLAYWVC